MATVVPTFPDSLKEAWAAASKELPQTQGVEKLLDCVGASIGFSFSTRTPVLKRPYR